MKTKITVRPVKTVLGNEFGVIVSKWFGLVKNIEVTAFTKDYAILQARELAKQFKAEFVLI